MTASLPLFGATSASPAGLSASADDLHALLEQQQAAHRADPLPPQIILFIDNLWDMAEGDENVFRDEVRTTVLHEIGHYFGLDEADLEDRGLE